MVAPSCNPSTQRLDQKDQGTKSSRPSWVSADQEAVKESEGPSFSFPLWKEKVSFHSICYVFGHAHTYLSATCFSDENNALQVTTKYRIIIIISFPGPDYLAKIRVKKYGMNQHFFFWCVPPVNFNNFNSLSKLKYQTIVLVRVSITVNELYVL